MANNASVMSTGTESVITPELQASIADARSQAAAKTQNVNSMRDAAMKAAHDAVIENPWDPNAGAEYEKHLEAYAKRNPDALDRFKHEYVPESVAAAKETAEKTGSSIKGMVLGASKRIGEAGKQIIQHPIDSATGALSGGVAGLGQLAVATGEAIGGMQQQVAAARGDFKDYARRGREIAQDKAKSGIFLQKLKAVNTGGEDNPVADVSEVVAPLLIPGGAEAVPGKVLTAEKTQAAAVRGLSGSGEASRAWKAGEKVSGLAGAGIGGVAGSTVGAVSPVASTVGGAAIGREAGEAAWRGLFPKSAQTKYSYQSIDEVNRAIENANLGIKASSEALSGAANAEAELAAHTRLIDYQNKLGDAQRALAAASKEILKDTDKLQPTTLGSMAKGATAGGVLGAGYGGLTGAPGSDKTQPAVAGAAFGAGAAVAPQVVSGLSEIAKSASGKVKGAISDAATYATLPVYLRDLADEFNKGLGTKKPVVLTPEDWGAEVPSNARNVTPLSARDVTPTQKLLRDGQIVETPAPEAVVEQPKPAAPAPAAAAQSAEPVTKTSNINVLPDAPKLDADPSAVGVNVTNGGVSYVIQPGHVGEIPSGKDVSSLARAAADPSNPNSFRVMEIPPERRPTDAELKSLAGKTELVESSNLDRLHYDPETGRLFVKFKAKTKDGADSYIYEITPEENAAFRSVTKRVPEAGGEALVKQLEDLGINIENHARKPDSKKPTNAQLVLNGDPVQTEAQRARVNSLGEYFNQNFKGKKLIARIATPYDQLVGGSGGPLAAAAPPQAPVAPVAGKALAATPAPVESVNKPLAAVEAPAAPVVAEKPAIAPVEASAPLTGKALADRAYELGVINWIGRILLQDDTTFYTKMIQDKVAKLEQGLPPKETPPAAPEAPAAAPEAPPAPVASKKPVDVNKAREAAINKLEEITIDPESTRNTVIKLARKNFKDGLIDEVAIKDLERMAKDRDMGVEDLGSELNGYLTPDKAQPAPAAKTEAKVEAAPAPVAEKPVVKAKGKSLASLPPVEAQIVKTKAGTTAAPSAELNKKVSSLSTKKQLDAQKDYLIDAIAKLKEQAPEIPNIKDKKLKDEYEKHLMDIRVYEGKGGAEGKRKVERAIAGINLILRDSGLPKLTIEVPGDGQFTVNNTKGSLASFESAIVKKFGKGIAPLKPKATAYEKVSAKDLAEHVMTDEDVAAFDKEMTK